MIQGWLGGLLASPDSPTADLYVANAMGSALQRTAPTVFLSGAASLMVRHCSGRGWPPARSRTVFLIDDDVLAGLDCDFLPRLYRQKLRCLEVPWLRRMTRRADLIVAGSEVLAERLAGGPPVRVMRPYWSEPLAPLDHHDDGDGPFDIAFLGSRVHGADLRFVLPAVEAVLDAEPRARFHLSRRHLLPDRLARHPRVRRLPSGTWREYRRGLDGRRFHVALYPLLDTAFNRARSPNKLIEHAVVGAAPVYSEGWPGLACAGRVPGLLRRPNRVEAWAEAIVMLLADQAARRAIAEDAQVRARGLNDAGAQRLLWREVLS